MSFPPFRCWSGPKDAKMVLVGEAFGQHEDELKKPFVGESGKELFRCLGEAMPGVEPDLHAEIVESFKYGLAWSRQRERWLEAAGVAFTNTLNIRPAGNKIASLCCSKKDLPVGYAKGPIEPAQYLRPEFLPELSRLAEEIETCSPNLVVACGAKALWALCDSTKISGMRGAVTTGRLWPGKIIPTYHPAAVMRQWNWRPLLVADLMKASREAQFAEFRRPSRQIIFSPTIEEVREWIAETLERRPERIGADTETKRGQVTMLSLARSPSDALVIPFIDESKPGWSYWTEAEEIEVFEMLTRLFASGLEFLWQNGLYDIQYLWPMGLFPVVSDDTMLRHHSILPEMQKGLGFLGAAYSSEPSWKLMRTEKADTEKRDE